MYSFIVWMKEILFRHIFVCDYGYFWMYDFMNWMIDDPALMNDKFACEFKVSESE